MVDHEDTLSSAGYRVVRRFGVGVPDGCMVPLSLKVQEEKETQRQQPQRKLSVHQQIQEEIVRRSHGTWSRRSIIAPWIYQEADLFQSEIIQKAKREHDRKWNKAERQKRVKEELARIKSFLNNAYAYDTRIAKFKTTNEKKKTKEAKKETEKKEKEQKRRKKDVEQIETSFGSISIGSNSSEENDNCENQLPRSNHSVSTFHFFN